MVFRHAAFKLHQKHSQQAASTNLIDQVNSNEAGSLSPRSLWWVAWAIRIQDVIIDHKRLYIRYRSCRRYKLCVIRYKHRLNANIAPLVMHPFYFVFACFAWRSVLGAPTGHTEVRSKSGEIRRSSWGRQLLYNISKVWHLPRVDHLIPQQILMALVLSLLWLTGQHGLNVS